MRFEEDKRAFNAGRAVGYLLSYTIFTGALFLILMLTGKTGDPLVAVMITAPLTAVAYGVRRWLS